MKLSQIISVSEESYNDICISSVCFDTKKVQSGSLFFCLSGTKTDGHLFAEEAVAAGAAALVVERKLKLNVPQILVKDTRAALSLAAAAFYGNPAKKLKMVAVTGTNGKTTTTYILKSILDAAGKNAGVIGTNAIFYNDKRIEAGLTTPDPTELHATLKAMLDAGVEYVVMEASAHALELRKLDGIIFEVAAFTNFTQDHLDFFGSMDKYFEAKKKLFSRAYAKAAVINADDEKGRVLYKSCKIPKLAYGCLNPSDVFAIDLKMSVDGIKYILNMKDDIAEVRFSMPGKFNMYNTLCAAAVANTLGIELKAILSGIRSLTKVDGRFNIINTTKCSIIIDFAHTGDGLKNILSTIREFAPKNIITVFGCGGDRDKAKRPEMGRIVSMMSDYTIITSDNPRTECPDSIINDIVSGIERIRKNTVFCETDRKNAIVKAIENAGEGDIVLIAGKGAERYQDSCGIKLPYNDEEYILKLIEEKKI